MKLINFFSVVLVLTVLAACGKPPAAVAPRDGVRLVKLQNFPRGGSVRLVNNKLFMWKPDMTVADASAARDISDTIDELDALAGPVTKKADALNKALTQLKRDRVKTTSAITTADKKLKEEQAKPEKSEETIRKLGEELTKLKATKTSQDAQVAATDAEYKKSQATASDYSARGKEKVDRLMEVSEYYNTQPASFYFEFKADGSILANVDAWGLDADRDPRSFSTEAEEGKKATIGKVTYLEAGGVFVFDLFVYEDPAKQDFLRDTFHFRLGRIKLDDEAGRIFYGGEILRTRNLPDGKTETRRGMAKCADRST